MTLQLGGVAAAAPDEATLSAARSKLADGVELMKKGDAAGALAQFNQAYALVPSPKIFFDIGLARDALGQNAQALTAFTRFVEETESPNPASLAKAQERSATLKNLVASVNVICDVAGASVEVDGISVGTTPLHGFVFVEPGDHVFVATAGPQTGRQKLTSVAGRKVDLTLELALPPPNPPPATLVAPAKSPRRGESSTRPINRRGQGRRHRARRPERPGAAGPEHGRPDRASPRLPSRVVLGRRRGGRARGDRGHRARRTIVVAAVGHDGLGEGQLMRHLGLTIAAIVALCGCKGTETCRPGTAFVSFTFAGAAVKADTLRIQTCVDGQCGSPTPVKHEVGATTGSLEVDFSRYAPGSRLEVQATPMMGTVILSAPSSSTVPLIQAAR